MTPQPSPTARAAHLRALLAVTLTCALGAPRALTGARAEPKGREPLRVTAAPLKLKRLYDRPNEITDGARWEEERGRRAARRGPAESARLFPFVAPTLGGAELVATVCEGLDAPVVALYGARPPGYSWAPATSVVLYAPRGAGQEPLTLNLSAHLKALSNPSDFAVPHVTHALARDGVLYVSISHNTYASATQGNNARVYSYSARGEQLWESPPLVSNAHNFLLIGDVLLTGYGFTKEPDFLYQLSRHTGEVLAKTPLKSGPERLALDELGALHVRTYNRDVGFQLSR